MKKILLVIATILSLVLAGCGFLSSAGRVTDKYTTEPTTRVVPVFTGRTMTTITRRTPRYHNLVVTWFDESGREVTETFQVSKEVYDQYQNGDYVRYQDLKR